MRSARGFTLIELLVALAVFATLAAAVLVAAHWAATSQQRLEERWFASLVLNNHLAALELGLVTHDDQGQSLDMAGRKWWVEQQVMPSGTLQVQIRQAADGDTLDSWQGVFHAP